MFSRSGEARSYSSASTHILESSLGDEPHSPSSSSPPQNYLQHDVMDESVGLQIPNSPVNLADRRTKSMSATQSETSNQSAGLTGANTDRAKVGGVLTRFFPFSTTYCIYRLTTSARY